MTKPKIIDKLTAAGIEHDAALPKADLEKLLPPETETDEDDLDGITVGDPEVLRPVELPLVIKPGKDGWKNDAQAEYAANLNGYAYKNPKKWAKKKDVLVKRLIEIGNDPEAISLYKGNTGNLSYSNKLIQE